MNVIYFTILLSPDLIWNIYSTHTWFSALPTSHVECKCKNLSSLVVTTLANYQFKLTRKSTQLNNTHIQDNVHIIC